MMAQGPAPSKSLQQLVSGKPTANGLVIAITNDYHKTKMTELTGVHNDGEYIMRVFRSLNYAVSHQKNMKKTQLLKLLNVATQSTRYPKPYRIIVVFSGHGTADEATSTPFFFTQDCQKVPLKALMDPFMPSSSPAIATTPKIFLIDACLGSESACDSAITVPKGKGPSPSNAAFTGKGGWSLGTLEVPSNCNRILACSTSIGYRSFEMHDESIWLKALTEKIQVKGRSESVVNILSEVQGDLIKCFQQPGYRRAMTQPNFSCNTLGTVYFVPQDQLEQQLAATAIKDCPISSSGPPEPSEVKSKGADRATLNTMQQKGRISLPIYDDSELLCSGKYMFRSKVTFTLNSDNKNYSFESRELKSSKDKAKDDAAMRALRFLDSVQMPDKRADVKPSVKKQPSLPSGDSISTLDIGCKRKGYEYKFVQVPTLTEQEFQFRVNVKDGKGKLICTKLGPIVRGTQPAKHRAAEIANKKLGFC